MIERKKTMGGLCRDNGLLSFLFFAFDYDGICSPLERVPRDHVASTFLLSGDMSQHGHLWIYGFLVPIITICYILPLPFSFSLIPPSHYAFLYSPSFDLDYMKLHYAPIWSLNDILERGCPFIMLKMHITVIIIIMGSITFLMLDTWSNKRRTRFDMFDMKLSPRWTKRNHHPACA